jgi:hypothetical protein
MFADPDPSSGAQLTNIAVRVFLSRSPSGLPPIGASGVCPRMRGTSDPKAVGPDKFKQFLGLIGSRFPCD